MPEDEQHGNSSEEEEEEEDEPMPVRQQPVRMVVTDASAGYGQESAKDSPVAKTAPQAVVTTTSTTTKVAGDSDLAEAQEAAIEAARKRHQEAIEKARAEAIKMQEEARARAEAARQQQQQQFQEQQKLAAEEQRQQQIKAQQEAAKLQAEQRAAQLKAQQEAQKAAAAQKQQQVQQQQSKPAPPPPQQQKVLTPQKPTPPTPPTPTTPTAQKQAVLTPTQPKPAPVQPKAAAPPTKTPNTPKAAAPIQSKTPVTPNKSINNPPSTPISRQPPPLAKEPEPLQPPKPILAHAPFQPKNPKAENHSWPPPQEDEDQQIVESGKRNKILDDNSWQVQKRIQLEYQPIQPTKIQPPELDYEGEIKRTIVPQPAGFSKVQWNEFPEEEQKEKQSVPKVKAQDWTPENDSEHPVLKTIYQPGRIAPNPLSGRLWPPPGYGEEEQIEIGHANKVKTMGDDDWKQGEHEEVQNGDTIGNAPWSRQAAGGNVKNVQWPPPENQLEHGEFGRGKLNVQWPPSEQQEQELKQVEILQTHLPTKPHQREWPPAYYVAAQGGGVEAQ